MDTQPGINSPEYWDQRFQQDWSANGGESYTRAYGELLKEHLPGFFFQEMCREQMTVCDWGCAEGEAVAYLSQLYPELDISGVDVSATAIDNARKKYPSLKFAAENWLDPNRELPAYDVVFTSHVLEHFVNPLEIIQQTLARIARTMIIILVPYAEDLDRKDPEHFFRFFDSNLPVRWPGWVCTHFQVLDTRMRAGLCWRGQQALLVYAEENWAKKANPARCLNSFRGEAAALLPEVKLLEQEKQLLEQEKQLLRAQEELAKRKQEKQLLEQEKQLLRAQEELAKRKLEIQYLHDANLMRVNDTLRSKISTIEENLKKETAEHKNLQKKYALLSNDAETLQKELKAQKAESAQFASRNEQLSQDLARAESNHLETKMILHSPGKIALYYLRALKRRFGAGSESPAQKTHPLSSDAPHTDEEQSGRIPSEKTASSTSPKATAPEAKEIRVAPGARQIRNKDKALKGLTVACILDTFSYACFAPEANFIPVTPHDWRQTFQQEEIDFLFVESAWNGNDGAWQYRIASYANPAGNELDDLIQWCNAQDIPTVFWNKEDPPNFDRFIRTAVKFDYIFTTDENCVPAYREKCGHDRVYPLMFAAQPAIHNPVDAKWGYRRNVCFAGTYYADCFPERRRQMENLLAGSVPYGLDIFDRMHGYTGKDRNRYIFPEQFQPYIRGRRSYEEMLEEYKRYRVFLNVNSVQDSPTMFARRVFELLACGTPVVSTPSLGIEKIFGELVPQVSTVEETRKALELLVESDEVWHRRSIQGMRKVMAEHCYEHRLAEIAAKLGSGSAPFKPTIHLILEVGAGFPERIIEEILSQHFLPSRIFMFQGTPGETLRKKAFERWLEKTGCNAEEFPYSLCSDEEAHEKIRTALTAAGISVASYERKKTIEKLQQDNSQDYFALWDGKSFYGPHHLSDSVHALHFSGTSCVGIYYCFRINGIGEFCTPPPSVYDWKNSKYSKKNPHDEGFVFPASMVGKMEGLEEFFVERLPVDEPVGVTADSIIRYPYEFVYSSRNPEPLPHEIRAQVFI
ncbi:MAG TPA: glycosyltransferase [Candidatus Hydrogenedentes bacterium]|nr:glycosyltransferase [Candidatus Hydrogenedentota bacterium]